MFFYTYPHITLALKSFNKNEVPIGCAYSSYHGINEKDAVSLLKKYLPDIIHDYAVFSSWGNKESQLDFVLTDHLTYCVDIELDEFYINRDGMPIHTIEQNMQRDRALAEKGITTIRFSERQIFCHLTDCIKVIKVVKAGVLPSGNLINITDYHARFIENGWWPKQSMLLAEIQYRDYFSRANFEMRLNQIKSQSQTETNELIKSITKKEPNEALDLFLERTSVIEDNVKENKAKINIRYFFYKWFELKKNSVEDFKQTKLRKNELLHAEEKHYIKNIKCSFLLESTSGDLVKVICASVSGLYHPKYLYHYILIDDDIQTLLEDNYIVIQEQDIIPNLFFKLKKGLAFEEITDFQVL